MGFLSKIKKGLGNIFKGVKKVFKGVLKVFAKAMSNKWVRGALLVCSLIVPVLGMATAGWASAAGQGFAAQAGAALGNVARGVASMVVNTVAAPVKMLLNGGANVANAVGAEGLATTLSSTATTVGNTATSIFGNVSKDSIGQIMNRFSGTTDAAATAGSGAAAGATDALGNPTTDPSSADSGFLQQTRTDASSALNGIAGPVMSSAAPVAPAAPTGLLDRGLAFIQKNPELTKLVGSAVQGAMTPSEADIAKEQYKARAKYQQGVDTQWNSFDPGAAPGSVQGSPQPLAPPTDIDYRGRAEAARQSVTSVNPNQQYQPVKSLLQKPDYLRSY